MNEINTFIRRWPRCVLLMVLGATLGFAVAHILPQRFAASVYLNTSINYSRTGTLDDLEQDRLLGVVEDIINSDAVFFQACEKLDDCSPAIYREKITINRTLDRWSLTVTDRDAEKAANMASNWLDAVYQDLLTAQSHAMKADMFENRVNGLTACVQNAVSAVPGVACPAADLEDVTAMIEETAEIQRQERQYSKGISAALSIGEKESNQLIIRRAGRSRGFLTLCGMLCGLLVAFALVWLGSVNQSADKKSESNSSDTEASVTCSDEN